MTQQNKHINKIESKPTDKGMLEKKIEQKKKAIDKSHNEIIDLAK